MSLQLTTTPIRPPADAVDTYCANTDCDGQDGDGWGDCDVWDDSGGTVYQCQTCKWVWWEALP